MLKTIVDETKWLCRDNPYCESNSSETLLNDDGCMCVLGFHLSQHGIDNEYLLYQLTPCDVAQLTDDFDWNSIPGIIKFIKPNNKLISSNFINGDYVDDIITINDTLSFDSLDDRKRELKLLFKDHFNTKLIFKMDEPVKPTRPTGKEIIEGFKNSEGLKNLFKPIISKFKKR